jgi:hypothetical protein
MCTQGEYKLKLYIAKAWQILAGAALRGRHFGFWIASITSGHRWIATAGSVSMGKKVRRMSFFGFFLLAACSQADVALRPGPAGTYEAVGAGNDQRELKQEAMSEADKFCRDSGKSARILEQHTAMRGLKPDEGTLSPAAEARPVPVQTRGAMQIGHPMGASAGTGTSGMEGMSPAGDRLGREPTYEMQMRFACR